MCDYRSLRVIDFARGGVNGLMTFGAIQAYFQYMGMCSEPLTEAAYMINSLQSAFASAERTFEFLDDTEETKDTDNPVPQYH